MACCKIEVKCRACNKKLIGEEQSSDLCKKCMYEYIDKWLMPFWK